MKPGLGVVVAGLALSGIALSWVAGEGNAAGPAAGEAMAGGPEAGPAPISLVADAGIEPASTPGAIKVYKTPTCGCCQGWVDHLRAEGFEVEVEDRADLSPIKAELGIGFALQSCHTALIDGYVVEGHVPASSIRSLLEERPDVVGISVPGMPVGSPGMEGPDPDPYEVVAFRRDGTTGVRERYGPGS